MLSVSFDEKSSDRRSSIESYEELKKLSPKRTYNLILIDKTLSDIEDQQKQLLHNIYPKMTHMDFNIATALKFASKGIGYLYGDPSKCSIESKAKIFLSGLGKYIQGYYLILIGADEIFGGYMRYWVAFHRGGFEELSREMHFGIFK